eukprot:CAMPEP_0206373724 /NCGR_PEP_ID=MMETSP0294-20121207/7886_1 /ASSEMBLY_ACC=CAM_ASM_000327 /TAXON_ID=39354 /ORGANISM="Heterosigma akashiwo, Strain CCMP2393" /LENGTH=213 /DNA_ID=CAMNT_0053821371 /DNA_START=403 /DNA_END=1043 /DNA_ORIENTATION=+
MKAFPKYFDFEEALEIGDEELVELMKKKNFIFAIQPHGVMPMVNFCQHIKFASKGYPMVPTAVATVIYKMPIVKNVMGLFGIVNASKSCFTKALSQQSVDVYVGGMAELFLSDANSQTERLYLSKRKGFIKVAMRVGADVIPVYSFGEHNNPSSFQLANPEDDFQGNWHQCYLDLWALLSANPNAHEVCLCQGQTARLAPSGRAHRQGGGRVA